MINKIKRSLKFIWNEFIYGGHLLSLGTVSVVFTSAILLDILVSWDFLLIVYLITHIIYLFNRFKEYKEDFFTNYNRTRHISTYIKYIPFIIFCSTLIVVEILIYFSNQLSIVFGLLLLLFGLLYSICFKKLTKKITGFKNFYPSFLWALLVIFLSIYYSYQIDLLVFFISLFIFLRILLNTIFFDIKDIEFDKNQNFNTIPILYGKNKTLDYLHIINMFSFILIVIGVHKNIFSIYFLSFSIFCFYSFFYIQKAKNKNININKLSYLVVDGEYLLWLPVLFLSKAIYYG